MSYMPVGAVIRHRINTDGVGIVSLVAVNECHQKCKYCINKSFLEQSKAVNYTPEQLFDKVKIDNLYFLVSDGGVTFGGGEPLLFPDFISDFSDIVEKNWKINVETSLNVPMENVRKVIGRVDKFIVDIKDMDSDIYYRYCGNDNTAVIENLKLLLKETDTENIIIRIPEIPGFNSDENCVESIKKLKSMGFVKFNRFKYIVKDEEKTVN